MHMTLTVILGISEFTVSKLFACLTANRSCEEETTGSAPLNYMLPIYQLCAAAEGLGRAALIAAHLKTMQIHI